MPIFALHEKRAEKPAVSGAVQIREWAAQPGHGQCVILHLQRAAGNRAVERLLRAGAAVARGPSSLASPHPAAGLLQMKPAVDRPGDESEREADRAADQVIETLADSVVGAAPPRIQHLATGPGGQVDAAPSSVEQALAGPGSPLGPGLQEAMEQRFGHDFSRVRVHSDAVAQQSARDVSAQAYTVGPDVVFATGRFAPGTREGRRLIAHELAHVVQQSGAGGNGMPRLALQRKPDDKTPPASPSKGAAPRSSEPKGLNRTLYVVQNDVWNKLPPTVRASAVRELESLFAFVGAASTERPFSIKVVAAAQLPEQFDFSESVVSVIRGSPNDYVKDAFARQDQQIKDYLAQEKVEFRPATSEGREASGPERIGTGGGSRSLLTSHGKTYALLVAAGAVDIDEVIDSFFDNIEGLLEEQLENLPQKGRDPSKWPETVTSKRGTTNWHPQELLGVALARAIAHEARHEYVGPHAKTGLGQDSPFIMGEKTTAQFSKADQKAILDRIHELEKLQGRASVVPLFPQSMRKKPDKFPF